LEGGARENSLETKMQPSSIVFSCEPEKQEGTQEVDSRSFVIDLSAQDGDPSGASLIDVLVQGLLEEFPVYADPIRDVQSIGIEDGRGSIDGIREVCIRNGAETFQSVRG